jgi:hypothetical protein
MEKWFVGLFLFLLDTCSVRDNRIRRVNSHADMTRRAIDPVGVAVVRGESEGT